MAQAQMELRRNLQAGRDSAARRADRQGGRPAEGVLRDMAFVLHLTRRVSQTLRTERTLCASAH
jgi:hypothetical protein